MKCLSQIAANMKCSPFLGVLIIILANVIPHLADDAPPPIFILGDSTADVGTNTYLHDSKIRADFSPYGIDFPNERATGRFSNGFNSADYVARFLKLKRSPAPFLFLRTLEQHHFRKHLLQGANFASAGAGLLDIIGPNGSVVHLSEQINQLSTVKDNLTSLLGSQATETLLSKSLVFISVGSNDIFGYFATNGTKPPVDLYLGNLIETYSYHITNLYKLGIRKFGIISVPPVGCCPSQRLVQRLLNGTDGCFELENDVALSFHSALDSLLLKLGSQLQGFKYSQNFQS